MFPFLTGLHASCQISSNCDSVLAAQFRSSSGLLFGIVNVHIRRADAEKSVFHTYVYPNIHNLIAYMKFGALTEETNRCEKANVVIFGGDLNAITEDQVDFETERTARYTLPSVYYLKSKVIRAISKLFKLGTLNGQSGRNWTRGFYILDDESYYNLDGPDITLRFNTLQANFENFLRWHMINGFSQDLLTD